MPMTKPMRGLLPGFESNWIGREVVPGTVGYPRGIIAQYNFKENNPNDNAELIANNIFAAWDSEGARVGDPTGWTVTGESGNDPEVSEVGTGEGHGGVGTGMCNLYSSDGTLVYIDQTISLIVGRKYRFSINIDTIIAGRLLIESETPTMFVDTSYNTTGIKTFTFVATATTTRIILVRHLIEATDITFDDVSVKLCAAEDSSGNDHDMLMQRATSAISVVGKINRAFNFNGTTDFGWIANHPNFTPDGTPLSISVDIFMHLVSDFVVLSKGIYGIDGEWRLLFSSGDILSFMCLDNREADCYIGRLCNTPLTTYQNTWVHIDVTYDGGTQSSGIRLYLEGLRIDDTNYEKNVVSFVGVENCDHAVHAGRYSTSFADGVFGNMKIWNRELSGYELSRQFQNQYSAYSKRRHGGR